MSGATPNPPNSSWEFPGWGTTERILDLGEASDTARLQQLPRSPRLGVWASTAICGNDITSSCLYVTALSMMYAGVYAPLSLLLVSATLYLYRSIYSEVCTALPLNGGAYNALLNTTTKWYASVAACLTLLSYMATAVISAGEAVHYANNLWRSLPIMASTVGLLGFFAVLMIVGIRESARFAVAIFVFHLLSLTLLLVCMINGAIHEHGYLLANWQMPLPGGALHAIFFGFAAGMLGISGFESSANFIEEQAIGVFPKTLRNMWAVVTVFNPSIVLLALVLIPLREAPVHRVDLLAHLGYIAAGSWLRLLISVDAVLVLSGSVLTSFVGAAGLIKRMSLDRCLPQALLRENSLRHTPHRIVLSFFLLCCSVLMLTRGRVVILAGVYTLSFLSVMGLFAIGNILLKLRRARLKRNIRASWPVVIIGLASVAAALAGNVVLNPQYVRLFALYFAVSLVVVWAMFLRVTILKAVLTISEVYVERAKTLGPALSSAIKAKIRAINNQRVLFFTKGDNIAVLNKAALYVLNNEQNKHLTVVHCYQSELAIPAELAGNLGSLDRIYPELRIDLLLVKGQFSPELVRRLAKRLKVPENYMFISTPGASFPHSIADLGGVRLIV